MINLFSNYLNESGFLVFQILLLLPNRFQHNFTVLERNQYFLKFVLLFQQIGLSNLESFLSRYQLQFAMS
jgi:hypothetical protein